MRRSLTADASRLTASGRPHRRSGPATVIRCGTALLLACGVATACTEIGTNPDEPAAIEFSALPSPSVVIGDTLRNEAGLVMPARATVLNVRGDLIANAVVRYLYADLRRDTALAVDSLTGVIRALRASTGDARVAARAGGSLQVLRVLVITTRPDSVEVNTQPLARFTTVLPDTGRARASANTSSSFTATVRHADAVTGGSGVNAWLVRYELLKPANASNDTTAAVYLVDDQGRASVLDTTDASGNAGRRVRIRASAFPTSSLDSVIVRATATYRGRTLAGAPVRFALPVARGTPAP